MPELTELDRDAARDWIERWDRQQEVYLADREDRFTALIDAVEAGTGRPDPLVLDLGCGPGSLAVAAARPAAARHGRRGRRRPGDADPRPGRLRRRARAALRRRWTCASPGWVAARPRAGPPDAAVYTTALHWLPGGGTARPVRRAGRLLRPGGLFLDGDHFALDAKEPRSLARLDRALRQREDKRRFPGGHRRELGRLVGGRGRGSGAGRRTSPNGPGARWRPVTTSRSRRCSPPTSALRAAGFAEVGTLWQRGANRLLCGVMPGETA